MAAKDYEIILCKDGQLYINKKDGNDFRSDDSKILSEVDYAEITKWFKKYGEKKLEETKPKFKVGDWIINNITGFVYIVKDKGYGGYIVANRENHQYTISTEKEKDYRLWVIQDAKDGDILYTPKGLGVEGIFLVSGWQQIEGTGKTLCSNIGYRVDDDEIVEGGIGAIWWEGVKDPFFPAIKEQRDLLFQKMKEACYVWDAEKKELKKIEQKPAWSEEDESHLCGLIGLLEDVSKDKRRDFRIISDNEKDDIELWLKSLKDRVQPQPKQEWSEEVEAAITLLKDIAEEQEKDYCPHNANNLRKAAQYLETCRPQSTWKPSEEQMEVLDKVVDRYFGNSLSQKDDYNFYVLKKLKKQLKAL